ncbi:hypothetical protein KAR48_08880 [bacterium]|nr:hypothetical protein [bacterium]
MGAWMEGETEIFHVHIEVRNILNMHYFHPGLAQADSGDDFTLRSKAGPSGLILD